MFSLYCLDSLGAPLSFTTEKLQPKPRPRGFVWVSGLEFRVQGLGFGGNTQLTPPATEFPGPATV